MLSLCSPWRCGALQCFETSEPGPLWVEQVLFRKQRQCGCQAWSRLSGERQQDPSSFPPRSVIESLAVGRPVGQVLGCRPRRASRQLTGRGATGWATTLGGLWGRCAPRGRVLALSRAEGNVSQKWTFREPEWGASWCALPLARGDRLFLPSPPASCSEPVGDGGEQAFLNAAGGAQVLRCSGAPSGSFPFKTLLSTTQAKGVFK